MRAEEADLPIRLAIEIAQLREKQGLSQKELAERAGTKQQVISRIEKLEHTNLTFSSGLQIAKNMFLKQVRETVKKSLSHKGNLGLFQTAKQH